MAFAEWLKYFFLSFFSNKIAAQSSRRSIINALLALALAVTFIYFAFLGGTAASFGTFYNRSADYKAFINNAFSEGSEINVVIEDGVAYSGKQPAARLSVNTYRNEAEAKKYAVNGYNLIIDTREPLTTYNDFKCVYKKGESEISHEQYHGMSEGERAGYEIVVTYTPDSIELTDGKIQEYKDWILANGGEQAAAELEKLTENSTIPQSNYNLVYELYFKYRYPDVTVEKYGKAPTMRTYYIDTFLSSAKYDKFLIILSDAAFTLFRTDDGVSCSASGFYTGLDGLSAADDADAFIKSLHKASMGMLSVNYLVNMSTVLLLTLIVWLIISLIVSVAGSFCKFRALRNFTGGMKVSGVFALFGGIIAALFAFTLSFFRNINTVFFYTLVVFFVAVAVRTLIYAVCMILDFKKGKIDGDGEPVYTEEITEE